MTSATWPRWKVSIELHRTLGLVWGVSHLLATLRHSVEQERQRVEDLYR